jgi:hypothetical protein
MGEKIFGYSIVGIVIGVVLLIGGFISPLVGGIGIAVLALSCVSLVLTFLIEAAIYLLR